MENKKRKEKEDESDEELDEEKKMDKFYSLLRSFREARDRRRRELEELDRKKKKKGKTETTSSPPSIWVPSFESGDFTTEVEFRRPPLIFPSAYNPSSTSTSTSATTSPSNPCDVKHKGNNKLQDQHQDDVLGLNLNLAL